MFKNFRPGTRGWKKFMAKLYGLGASVVIIGALFKIQHYPGAGPLLVLGLTTEAIIFAFSAFEPIHEELDWSLVYPELAGMHGDADKDELAEEKLSVTEQLDNMLEEAKIGPDLIASLGSGMKNLSEQAGKMADISQASVATSEYVSSVRSASQSANELSSSYTKAAQSIMGISMSTEDSANALKNQMSNFMQGLTASSNESETYSSQLSKVSKNLTSLNSMYELQLKGSEDHVKATAKIYAGIETLMENLTSSVDDTRKYKQEISALASNLENLNTVYGNMLTAMNVRKG